MTQGLALLAFLLIAALVAGSMLAAAAVLRVTAKRDSTLKRETYECGESPEGPSWVRFHARYYVVALFFVLFDVEAVFLMPWATLVRQAGVGGLWAIATFVGVLMLGWAWAVRKGALKWQ
jgi:NADH-quinone oxidoreductase subunit A